MIKVIKFSAKGCGPCKNLSPIFNEVRSEMPDVSFQEVDVDQSPDLAIKYNVRGVPTIVIEKDNQEVTRKSGLIMNAALTHLINSYK
jgi:thioredoxin 1